jgi:hypothetical protein
METGKDDYIILLAIDTVATIKQTCTSLLSIIDIIHELMI